MSRSNKTKIERGCPFETASFFVKSFPRQAWLFRSKPLQQKSRHQGNKNSQQDGQVKTHLGRVKSAIRHEPHKDQTHENNLGQVFE
jgi:hypothetical protein